MNPQNEQTSLYRAALYSLSSILSVRESNLAILGAKDSEEEFVSVRDLYDEIYTPPGTEGTPSTSRSPNPAYMSGGLGCNSLTLEVGDVSLDALAGESSKRP